MGGEEAPKLIVKNKGQTIIMLCGLQGNGKTTHAAKLAKYFIKQGRRPMLVACDIYRPAAIDQLKVVGKQAGAPVFTLDGEKPPVIAKKALAHAKDYGNDILILDTAGRLQIDEVLMQELVDIKEAVPVDETLLVVDAMAGQDAVNVARTFNETVGIDGIILTKTDGDTRGGAAFRCCPSPANPSSSRAPAKSWTTSKSSIHPAWPAASSAWAMCSASSSAHRMPPTKRPPKRRPSG